MSGLLPRLLTLSLASKMSQVCDKEEQTPKNQIQPRCQLTELGLEQREQPPFISLHASFVLLINKMACPFESQEGPKAQGMEALLYFNPDTDLGSLCVIHDQSK